MVYAEFVLGDMHIKVTFLGLERRVGKNMTFLNYPVGDFLIQLKNAARARKREVVVDSTKLIKSVATAMKKEGYLESVVIKKGKLIATLAYRKKEPVLMDIKLVSRPGMRVYQDVDDLERYRGPSIFILTTPIGIISSREAIKKRVGGEVIVKVL